MELGICRNPGRSFGTPRLFRWGGGKNGMSNDQFRARNALTRIPLGTMCYDSLFRSAAALRIAARSDRDEKGFARYAMHPVAMAFLRMRSLALPVIKMTGSGLPE